MCECVVIYEEEATDRMMKEIYEKAIYKEFVRLAKKQAREDKQQLTGTKKKDTIIK